MRRLAWVASIFVGVVGIVLLITTGRAEAQRRIRFEKLGAFELFKRLLDEEGKTSLVVGGAIGSTRAGAAREGLVGLRYAGGNNRSFVTLDARLSASTAPSNAVILEGSHRALARTGDFKLDLAIDHSATGRSFSLRSDVAPEPYRDVSVGGGVDLVVKPLRDGAVVTPLVVRGRRVSYAGGRPGLTSIEVSAGVGARFAIRASGDTDKRKGGLGLAEMFGVKYTGTRFEEAPGMHYAAPVIHQIDLHLLNYDQIFFHDGPFAFSMYLRMGYGHLENQTTGVDGGAPIFTYGMQAEDKTGGIGLLYSVAPGTSEDGEIVSVWRVEALARARRPKLGAWDVRFGWTCSTPDTTDEVCGDRAVGRAALEMEAYLELPRSLQVGASYLGDYGPWRGTREWRNEALAFLRWDLTR